MSGAASGELGNDGGWHPASQLHSSTAPGQEMDGQRGGGKGPGTGTAPAPLPQDAAALSQPQAFVK